MPKPREKLTQEEFYNHFHDGDDLKAHRIQVMTEALRSYYTPEEVDRFNPDFRHIAFIVRDIFEQIPFVFEVVDEEETRSDQVKLAVGSILKCAELLSYMMPQTAAYREALDLPKRERSQDEVTVAD